MINPLEWDEYKPGIKAKSDGASIQGFCQNPKCIGYQQNVTVPLDFGRHSLTQTMRSLKCPICPYRDLDMNPPLSVKNVQFRHCGFKQEGRVRNRKGFEESKSAFGYRIVEKKANKSLYNLIDDEDWVDMQLDVKPL